MAKEAGVGERVADLSRAFLARRNYRTLRTGDRIITQTGSAGQVEALVMGRREGDVLIRLSRWAGTFEVEPERVLRVLSPAEAVA